MDYQQFLDKLLNNLMHEDGSDLHLGTLRKPAVRINGELIVLVNEAVLKAEDMMGILSMLVSPERIKIFLEKKEMDFVVEQKGRKPFLFEVKLSDAAPSTSFALFRKYFPMAEQIQLVRNLDREFSTKDGIEVRSALDYLAALDLA